MEPCEEDSSEFDGVDLASADVDNSAPGLPRFCDSQLPEAQVRRTPDASKESEPVESASVAEEQEFGEYSRNQGSFL